MLLTRLPGEITPAFNPHARGTMCGGKPVPAPEAAQLMRAPLALRDSTPLAVRFSTSAGIPHGRRQRLPGAPVHKVPTRGGSDSADDPLTAVRSDLCLLSGRRRRAAAT